MDATEKPGQVQALVDALSAPDAAPAQTCPAVGQVAIEILVKTSAGVWSAHPPLTACNLFQEPLKAAIRAAVPPR